MAILKVARMGHPVLRQKCAPIDPQKITGPEVQGLIRDMFETMVEYNGVGLAAPQVHQPVQLAICGGEADDVSQVYTRSHPPSMTRGSWSLQGRRDARVIQKTSGRRLGAVPEARIGLESGSDRARDSRACMPRVMISRTSS